MNLVKDSTIHKKATKVGDISGKASISVPNLLDSKHTIIADVTLSHT